MSKSLTLPSNSYLKWSPHLSPCVARTTDGGLHSLPFLCLSPATYLELLRISLAFAALNIQRRLLSASLSAANTESSRFGIIL